MSQIFYSILTFAFCLAVSGCATSSMNAHMPFQQQAVQGPVFVAANNEDAVWERTIDVLHNFQFKIARENKLDGVIETEYKTGAGLLEPWHRDSVGFANRLESSLQSIRRRAYIHVTPAEGGYLLSVEAFKELEDLPGLAANSPGGATFQENTPLQRDLDLVIGQTSPSGWVPQGRDLMLEQALLASLQANFSR